MSSSFSIRENPEGIEERYLRCLQDCFPGAWDRRSFAWFHLRKFRERSPDLLTVYEGDRLVAGVCINFRQLRLADDRLADVGILTAAWTLPGHRGRWHLARLIKAAHALGARRRYDGLIAFVRAGNASSAVLRRAGAAPVKSFYIRADPCLQVQESAETSSPGRSAARPAEPTSVPTISFHDADAAEWRSQFLDRPGETTVTEAAGCSVISEFDGSTNRVQNIDGPEISHSAAVTAMALAASGTRRTLYHYSTSLELARRAAACGLNVERGYIMVFDLGGQAGDRLPSLLDTHANWRVNPGDRM